MKSGPMSPSGAVELGVEVGEIGIKDVILPGEVRELLNKVVEAERVAKANLIRRQEETAATRSLLNTSRLMEDNPLLLRLKELEGAGEAGGKSRADRSAHRRWGRRFRCDAEKPLPARQQGRLIRPLGWPGYWGSHTTCVPHFFRRSKGAKAVVSSVPALIFW